MLAILEKLRSPNTIEKEQGLLEAQAQRKVNSEIHNAILESLFHPEASVRELAAEVLYSLRFTDLASVSNLLRCLNDKSAIVRENLLQLLAIFPQDRKLGKLLMPWLSDPDVLIRCRAAAAIWKHTEDKALIDEVIATALRSDDVHVVICICQLVAELGPNGQQYVGPLSEIVARFTGPMRGNAFYALTKCCNDKAVLDDIQARLAEDEDPLVRCISEWRVRI